MDNFNSKLTSENAARAFPIPSRIRAFTSSLFNKGLSSLYFCSSVSLITLQAFMITVSNLAGCKNINKPGYAV